MKITDIFLTAILILGLTACTENESQKILTAVDFVKEHLGVKMEKAEVKCSHSRINNQCIGKKCPFSPVKDTNN